MKEGKRWTTEEDLIITSNPDKTAKELQAMLPDRSQTTVSWRKSYLKRQDDPEAQPAEPKPKKQSKPFSPEPIVLKTKADLITEPKPGVSEYHKSYIQTESIQAKAEAAKAQNGTYKEPKPDAPVMPRAEQPSPILPDELNRLRCRIDHLEGVIEGVKLVLDRIRVTP